MKNKKEIKETKIEDMSTYEIAGWTALCHAIRHIYDYADKHGVDMENVNLDTRKILKTYVDPMRGDIIEALQTGDHGNKLLSL